jgi:ribonuclease Z
VIGHYSGRYPDTSLFQKEAETVFENVSLAKPGAVFTVE